MMNTRTTLPAFAAAMLVSLLLAACGAAGALTPSASPDPTASPSPVPSSSPEPSEEQAPPPAGTLTVADGAVADGKGLAIAEALAGDLSQPVLVRGVLYLADDGQVYLADELVDASTPTFGELRLSVANYPTDGPTWDMAAADLTGLQEVNGIRFFADTKLYGTIHQ